MVKYRCAGRFFGRRVNCEDVPTLPAWAVRRCLDDPRKVPYLLVWKSPWDGKVNEAVRVACLGPTPYLPEADSIEVKRTDGSVSHLRALKRPLPGNVGYDVLLACPRCCSMRRSLYGWEPGGRFTSSVQISSWQCRACGGLRYASEGGALRVRSRSPRLRPLDIVFSAIRRERVQPWEPLIFTRPEQAAEAGLCKT
jgi:hypothetical protein